MAMTVRDHLLIKFMEESNKVAQAASAVAYWGSAEINRADGLSAIKGVLYASLRQQAVAYLLKRFGLDTGIRVDALPNDKEAVTHFWTSVFEALMLMKNVEKAGRVEINDHDWIIFTEVEVVAIKKKADNLGLVVEA